ncbi:branched-chain amino acid ABC transporter permease [Ralstonia solanacearum]|uniref:AzlC family ABC transporter permease n=1 Tax=Ralstonia solanacearum TaxID=305 RepID=A0AAE3NIE3_RALSL|nr:AzlC family ABC transporter permease [Ralstonia solanacearum]KFX28163.1 branched-chain amino acid permease [Ralstonia solanacearum]MBB6583126.1 AzlC family ABC transporter permease [Ralstonia solanacearum]MDB0522820.1 AzlC family ABC transporter permease [Ralstonia solanacearum]QHB54116.1 branched-chain amino acid ABC transporter permease [Ralstonia solanacearum]
MALVRWGAALQRRWQAIDPAERAGFVAGARFYVRSVPPVFTWGLVTGVAMSKSVLTLPQAIGMSLLVYAGSSQLAVLPLLAAGLPVWTVLLTAFIVNVRFIIFSAGLVPHFGHLPFGRRVMLGFINGDLPFVLFAQRFPGGGPEPGKEGYFWGMTLSNWAVWQVSSVLGIVGASLFPDAWGLALAGTLALIPVMVSTIRSRATLMAVAVAALLALVAFKLPYRLSLVIAVVGAMAAGLAGDEAAARLQWQRRRALPAQSESKEGP